MLSWDKRIPAAYLSIQDVNIHKRKSGEQNRNRKNNFKESQEKNAHFQLFMWNQNLIIPEMPEMNKAIKNRLIEHKKLTGSGLSEENLTQEILKVVIKAINET